LLASVDRRLVRGDMFSRAVSRGAGIASSAALASAAGRGAALAAHGGDVGVAGGLVRHFALAGRMKRREKERVRREGGVVGDSTGIPSVSQDAEVFAAQQRLFGFRDADSGSNVLKKEESWQRRLEVQRAWFPPTLEEFKQSVRLDLKRQRFKLKTSGAPAAEIQEVQSLLEIFRFTPDQAARKQRLVVLKRRGKGPPKKGQGKRR